MRTAIFGVEWVDRPRILRDWELLERLNIVAEARGFRRAASSLPATTPERFVVAAREARGLLERELPSLKLSYSMPVSSLVAALWPLDERTGAC
ncbi:MAG: hypothetical protein LC118_21845 [Dehalococcoidia bacterium]|nr:hypothetical protein [Dehalococcoidia bacterium]